MARAVLRPKQVEAIAVREQRRLLVITVTSRFF